MKSVSITPGKNNVGAYINDVNLNKLNNDLTGQIKDILNKYGVIFIKKQNFLKLQIYFTLEKVVK